MANSACCRRAGTTDNPGVIAPPPLLYLGAFFMGTIMNFVQPEPIPASASILRAFGIALLFLSASVARWSFVTMKSMGTSADPRKKSSALATGGPFGFSRNPIYVAMTGLYLGTSFLSNSLWILLFLAPLLLVMHRGVILREERYLEREFGEAYRNYKSKTPRWL